MFTIKHYATTKFVFRKGWIKVKNVYLQVLLWTLLVIQVQIFCPSSTMVVSSDTPLLWGHQVIFLIKFSLNLILKLFHKKWTTFYFDLKTVSWSYKRRVYKKLPFKIFMTIFKEDHNSTVYCKIANIPTIIMLQISYKHSPSPLTSINPRKFLCRISPPRKC